MISFYADWCRYSAALKPIYDKAADQIAAETVSVTVFTIIYIFCDNTLE